jgi:hypothetical protein
LQRASASIRSPYESKLAGFLLLPAGAIIVLTAVALLPAAPARAVFVLAGVGVEILGLAIAVRSHAIERGNEK